MPNQYGGTAEKNKNRLPLPANAAPTGAVCIQISIPNDPEYLNVFWGAVGRLAMQQSWQRDEEHTAKTVAAVWANVIGEAKLCVATDRTTDKQRDIFIEDCNDMRDLIINIADCGCGDSDSTTGGKSGGSIGVSGGGSGGFINDTVQALNSGAVVTVCDWSSGGGCAYILDQVKESCIFWENLLTSGTFVQVAQSVLQTLTIGTSETVTNWLATVDEVGFQPIIALMDDAQFLRAYQQAWIASFGSSSAPQPEITQQNLQQVARRLGFASFSTGSVSLPSLTMQAMSYILNKNDINLFRIGLQGQGVQALCEQLSLASGTIYTPPVLPSGSVPTDESVTYGQFKYTLVFGGGLSFNSGAGAVDVCQLEGNGAGYIVQYECTSAGCPISNCGVGRINSTPPGLDTPQEFGYSNTMGGARWQSFLVYSVDGQAAVTTWLANDAFGGDTGSGTAIEPRYEGMFSCSASAHNGGQTTFQVVAVYKMQRVS